MASVLDFYDLQVAVSHITRTLPERSPTGFVRIKFPRRDTIIPKVASPSFRVQPKEEKRDIDSELSALIGSIDISKVAEGRQGVNNKIYSTNDIKSFLIQFNDIAERTSYDRVDTTGDKKKLVRILRDLYSKYSSIPH